MSSHFGAFGHGILASVYRGVRSAYVEQSFEIDRQHESSEHGEHALDVFLKEVQHEFIGDAIEDAAFENHHDIELCPQRQIHRYCISIS